MTRDIPVARLVSARAEVPDELGGRIARLVRSGIVSPPDERRLLQVLEDEPPRLAHGASAVDALLAVRAEGR